MKRLFFLLAVTALALTACNNKLTQEQAKKAVMQGETDRLPIMLQSLTFVDDITIDSLQLLVTDEPMQGMLYTTWKRGKKTQTIIVQVDSIRTDINRKNYIQWESNWEDAARAYFMKSLGF